jgi:hypothetical protein
MSAAQTQGVPSESIRRAHALRLSGRELEPNVDARLRHADGLHRDAQETAAARASLVPLNVLPPVQPGRRIENLQVDRETESLSLSWVSPCELNRVHVRTGFRVVELDCTTGMAFHGEARRNGSPRASDGSTLMDLPSPRAEARRREAKTSPTPEPEKPEKSGAFRPKPSEANGERPEPSARRRGRSTSASRRDRPKDAGLSISARAATRCSGRMLHQ